LKAFPRCKLYCFEPEQRALMRVDPPGFFSRIGDDIRVSLFRVAVSDTDGYQIFHVCTGQTPDGTGRDIATSDWDMSGSLCKPTGHLEHSPWVLFPEDKQMRVPTTRLDTWLEFHPFITGIDLLWADIQGAEGRMIAGATKVLRSTRYVYAETADPPLYERQLTAGQLASLLPEFEVIASYGAGHRERNLLLKRKNL
jgi:FkbM family methyltransferase